MKKHIVIVGHRHCGKSTIIQRLIEDFGLDTAGFYTKAGESDSDGYHNIYIYDASSAERTESERNLIGKCNGRNRIVFSSVFDDLGVRFLSRKTDGVIIMDEIGFMESDSPGFCSKVLELLDGSTTVIAAAKADHCGSLLDCVRSHENAYVFSLSAENRISVYTNIYDTLKTIIK